MTYAVRRKNAVPHVRTAFDRIEVGQANLEPSMTKQEFADECDINNIMKRYEKDGYLAHFNKYQGQYGDFTDAPDFHEAQNKVIAATEMFMTLPAALRSRFENDPGKFLEFVGDPKNVAEMNDLGLVHLERHGDMPAAVPDEVKSDTTSEKK